MPAIIFASVALAYICIAFVTLLEFGKLEYVLSSLAICLLVAVVFLSLVFVLAQCIKRYDIIDAAWGPTFIVVCLASYFVSYKVVDLNLCLLVIGMVTLWGLRLAWHIGKRKVGSKLEDARYVELRRNWKGNLAVNMYFRVYMVQALLATIICIPVIHINLFTEDNQWTILTLVGLLVWLIGFATEVAGDRQLKVFLADKSNRGEIMQSGLWRYSRHPNYFGELVQWWGIGVIAASVSPWWVGLIGPFTITFLILYVSGIPPTEKRFEGRTGWEQYKKKTSVVVPLPVRK